MNRSFHENAGNYHTYSALKCNAHYDMAEMYRKRHRLFGVIVVVVTALVGTSVFAALGQTPDAWLQILTGLLSVGAVVLSALQTFLAFSDLQANYKASASGYGSCRRDIELLVMKFPSATGLADEAGTLELEKIKQTLDELDRTSPTLPERLWNAVRAKNDLSEHAPKPVFAPDSLQRASPASASG